MAVGAGLRTHVVGLREDINRIVASVNRKGIVIRVRASDFTQPLGRMSAKANEFTKSLEASNARVIAFGASAAIIGGVTTSFAQLFVQAQKVEKILTDINVVLGTTASNLQKFGDSLFKVARNTSQALEVAAEAALEFSRQGLSMEETLKRTNDALILTRLTGLKAADSVKGLTAAVNGFADAGLTTTQIINKLAAVDVKFAVSADDLINALARAGAVAQDAGVSFDQLIGSVTAAQQITARGGAVIGNSFKTIFTRIQRTSTIKRLEELGVAVRDIRGNTLPAITVLTNLSKAYDQLGDTTKAAVAEQVGGVFQINILKAALKDLGNETSLYAQATKISSRATDEAQRKNEQLQKTLAAISNQSFTNLRELTANLGELSVAPALKEFLKSFNKIAEVMNSLLGSEEGESIGGDFAKGFARAFGSVLTGPGLAIGVLIFGKLFKMAFTFAKNSVKDIINIKNIKDQELAIQESIVDAMIKNVALNKELFKLDGDQVKQEQVVLKLLEQQTQYLEKQRQIAINIAPFLRKAGVSENLIVKGIGPDGPKSRNQKAQGLIPNYASKNAANSYGGVTPMEKQSERAGAMKAGYTPGSIKSTNISGLGRVIYNDAETIKQFPNMKQPAIMPPLKSKAGQNYKTEFKSKHGFNPYNSDGLIPNFAKLFKAYDGGGRYVGAQNDYFVAKNLGQAKLRMEANPFFRDQKSKAKEIREFNISDGMWEALRSKTPARVIEREGIQLPDMTPEGRQFIKAARSKYNMSPPLFRSSGGGAFATNLINSSLYLSMFGLAHGYGIPHKYSASQKQQRRGHSTNRIGSANNATYSDGFMPNFAKLFKAYDGGGRYVGAQNDYFVAKNLGQAKLRMEANPFFRDQKSKAKEIREFNISDGMWEALRSKTPARVIEREGIQLPDMTPEGRQFIKAARSKYNMSPPLFRSSGGGAFATNLINSSLYLSMFGLAHGYGIPHKYSASQKQQRRGHSTNRIGSANNATYSDGFMPNFAAQPMAVKSAIIAALKKRGARLRPNDPKLDFAMQRYLSATKSREYPDGFINIGGHKINMNEITLALKKQGDYHGSFNDSKAINLEGSSNNKTYDSGLIPNFALAAQRLGNTNILRLPTAKMVTQTTQSDFRGNRVKGWRTLEAPLDNIAKFAASYKPQFQALKGLGFNALQRKMYFGNQSEILSRSDRRGLGSKNLNVRGDTYENVLFKSGLQNKGYSRTYDPNTKQGYKNATVDFTKSGGVPIEAKFGKFVPANLLAKSIRLSSDRYIEDFLSKKRFSGLANQMSATKLGEAQNTLSKMGYQNPDANLARTMGLSGGWIPNYVDSGISQDNISSAEEKAARYKKLLAEFLKEKKANGLTNWTSSNFLAFVKEKNPNLSIQDSMISKHFLGKKDKGKQSRIYQLLSKSEELEAFKAGIDPSAAGKKSVEKGNNYEDLLVKEFKLKKEKGKSPPIDFINGITEIPELYKSGTTFGGKKLGGEHTLMSTSEKLPIEAMATKGHKTSEMANKGMRYAAKHARKEIQKGIERAILEGVEGTKSKNPIQILNKAFVELVQKSNDEKDLTGKSNKPMFKVVNKKPPKDKSGKLPTSKNKGVQWEINMFGGYGASHAYSQEIKALGEAIEVKLGASNFNLQDANKVGSRNLQVQYDKDQLDLNTHPHLQMNRGLIPNFYNYNPEFGSHGLIPNYYLAKDKFNATRTALTNFNAKNALLGPTALKFGPARHFKNGSVASGIKLTKRNFGEIKGFINSREFRQLDSLTKNKILVDLKSQSKSLGLPDVTRFMLSTLLHIKPKDPEFGSHGLIPNFSNPLQDAIQREANAGVPKSLIRVDQDNSLRSTQNPMGLAVTNTRDEPAGVKQGIQRAKQMGIDPKFHGSSSGFLPNFNTPKNPNKANKGRDSGSDTAKATEEASAATKEAGGAMDGLMMKMFALTTVTYALEGAVGEAENGFTQLMKVVNSGVMGLAQASMVAGLGRETGKGWMEKGAKTGGRLGGLQKAGGMAAMALGPLIGAVALAVPVFNALKENTTWLDSGLDTLRKSAEKTSKGINALGSAMTAATGIQETRTKLVELDNSAMAGTYQGEMQRLKLNAQLIKQQYDLGNQAAQLGKHLNLSGKEIKLMTSGTTEGMKKLQEAMLKAEQSMSVQNAMSGFILGSKGGGIFGDDPDPLKAEIQKLNLANIVSTSVDPDKLEAHYATMLEKVNETGEKLESSKSMAPHANELHIMKFKESISESDLPVVLKAQISAALDGKKSFEEMAKFLEEQEITVKKLNRESKKTNEMAEVNLLLMREIANQRQKILTGLKIENIAYQSQIKMAKMGQDFDMQKLVHQNKIIESLEILSNQSIADLQMKEKSRAIDNDFNNKKEALNREALQAQRDLVKDLFTEGGKFNSAEMFADLRKPFTRTITNVAIGETYDETFEGGSKQAHAGQLEIIRKKLIKAEEKQLAANLKGAENYQRANNITMDYLLSLKKQADQASLLSKLQALEFIPANLEIESLLEEIADTESAKLDAAKKEREERIKNLNLVRNELEANSKTVAYAKDRAAEYETQKAALGGITGVMKAIEAKYYEEIDARNIDLAMAKEISNGRLQVLTSAKYQKDLAESLEGTVQKQLITELESLVNQGARLDAEKKVKENTQLFAKILETKVKNEIKELNEGAGDDTDLLQEELRQGKFRIEANTNYITSQNNLTRQQEQFIEALKRGQFGLDALAEIQGTVNDLIKSMEMAKTQMAFYANQEGSAGTGNEIKGAEATLKYAQAQKELNIEQNKGTLFADSMAVKIAEANVAMARFGETLANTTFDAVQDGFKGFVTDMLSGTKSLGDAALGFAHGIVSKIHEQLLNRATSQITAGIFEALDLGKPTSKQGGGIVSRYSTGGSVGRVPAMLTNGEYVVKKKIVDKLGVNDLNKINQTGSLEDLYNKPNENGFEMMNNGGLAMPPIIKLKEGGSIQNYLAKRDQSSDSGSQNERTIVDGEVVNTLSNTIAKFMGGLAKFSFGGRVKEATKNSLISDPNDSAGVKIAKGSGYVMGTVVGGYEEYEPQAYSGPVPVKVNPLNTRSMLNVDPYSRSMSARFKAQDDYSSKYGDYLLDKYQHDVNERNKKLESRASNIQGIVNQIGMMGVMYGTEQAVRSAFQPEKRKEYHTSIDNSQVNAFRDYQINQQTKSDRFLNNNTSISQDNISSAYSIGGGNLFSNQDQFIKRNSYGMSEGGRVHGPAGIDKVGPVMLDRGEFVIKASSVNKVEKQYPGFFDQLNTMKFNQGGVVDPSASSANVQNSEVTNNQSSSSNVTVNINVSAGGETTVNGGAGDQQAFASKIKEAVVNVISQEKRVGGMLR